MVIVFERQNIFSVIARESGQSSNRRSLRSGAAPEPHANGVLDGPLSRAMTALSSW